MNIPDNMTLQATVHGAGGEHVEPKKMSWSDRFSWPGRIAVLLALVLSPWAFGSVENWAQQWVMICLLFGAAFWWFETALNQKKSQVFPTVFFLVLAGLVLAMLQTVPLPESIANLVLGRQAEIYADYSGVIDAKSSVSLDREGTWNHIRLLMIALSGLVLGCRYFRSQRDITLLMSVVAGNGVLISFFGIIHKFTSNGKMFWIHEATLGGMPFGPFVNRNNGAGYLLMCLACCIGLLPIVMARQKNEGQFTMVSKDTPFWRQWSQYMIVFVAELNAAKVAILFAIAITASGVIASLSRGATVGMIAGAIGTLLVYGMARRPKNFGFVIVPLLLLVVTLSGWVGFWEELGGRFDEIDIANVEEADSRVQHWKETLPAVSEMGWFGSGLGSYIGLHRLYRIDNEGSLFHYAENQYFQALVEAGPIGLGLFLIAWLLAYQYASLSIYRGNSATTIGVGTMGVFLVFSQSLSSFFDFGLYITSNLLLMSVLVGFLAFQGQSLAGRLKRKSRLRFELSNRVVQVIVLVMFAGGTMVALDLYRRAQLDRLMVPRVAQFSERPLDLNGVNLKLAKLTPLVQKTPTAASLNYVGELWVYRFQLESFLRAMGDPLNVAAAERLSDEDRNAYQERQWALTSLQRTQENAYVLRREGTAREVKNFLNSPQILGSLPQAASCFSYSTQRSPLQPLVHRRLAEVIAIIGQPGDGDVGMERALGLAPGNADFHLVAGIYYLHSDNYELAAQHFRRFLVLKPSRYSVLIGMLKGRNYQNVGALSDQLIVEKMIDFDPRMLYLFATIYLDDQRTIEKDALFQKCLEQAALLLEAAESKQRNETILLGKIRMAQEEFEAAIAQFQSALISQPNNPKIRKIRAELLVEMGELESALEEAQYLVDHDRNNRGYNTFRDRILSLIKQRDTQ